MKSHILRSRQGFTLIEVVISLIVAGIMGTMLVTMGQTALTRSAGLVNLTRNAYNLETVMENINSDYISMINPDNTGQSILDDLATRLPVATNYAPAGYAYTVNMLRFDDFVDGDGETLVVPENTPQNGNIMRVTISDASGMSLTALFFDNSN